MVQPMVTRRIAVLVAALALAAPASAFAQSAGDEQYQDPFGDSGSSQSGGDDQSSGSSSGSAGETAQAAPTPAAVAPATATQTRASAAQQLPRTGGDPITPAVAGFWLVLGGVALRARLRLHERRP
jgi:hypothetical protein